MHELNTSLNHLAKRLVAEQYLVEPPTHKQAIVIPSLKQESSEDAPIIRWLNQLIEAAITRGASDLHFEPYEKSYRIRLRQDGLLHEAATPPLHLAESLAARIKVMSRLDIAERRLPQDGQFHLHLNPTKTIHCRVNTCPTQHGEKVVIRLQDPALWSVSIHELGYEAFQIQRLLQALDKPQGLLLVTGPTGSGKTVSLYAALRHLNKPERNMMTIEDPIEMSIPGINQVQVHNKTGLDFSTALRAFLRQDPDVIMIGEIRDLETAEIAVKAAQTGHLVLSTLHTNSTTETLTRLMNMGLARFNIASAISLIIAQRLARRLCPACKIRLTPSQIPWSHPSFNIAPSEKPMIYRAYSDGCTNCYKGYRGQVGIYELLPMSPAISEAILNGAHASTIETIAFSEGLLSLKQAGFHKVLAGITSLEEIDRVTGH